MAGAVVIVTYNSAAEIGSCLDAVAHYAPEWQVVVVDNRSNDQTVSHVKQRNGVILIENQENLGFAAGVNQGIRFLPGADPILLLNPDARLKTGLDLMTADCRQHGLASGKLVDSSGAAQAGFTVRRLPTAVALVFESLGINKLWPSNPVNRRYRCLDLDLNQPAFVEQPAGALLMFRRDVWEKLGGLDERFHPVWFEDVDFCKRALDAGNRISFNPAVTVEHDGGGSVGQMPIGNRAVFWYVSLLRYAAKHFTMLSFRTVCAAVVIGSIPRIVAGGIRERSLQSVRAYGKVIWVSVRSFFQADVSEASPAR
ncbi:MAG: glycosyltransferase family 2 protein [Bryobacteraceae bacterium]